MLSNLAILDFEATCADAETDPTWDSAQQEIIELPVVLVSIAERRVIDTFATFVRPTRQPLLTAFCTKLTSIRQEDVEGQPPIDEVLSQLMDWLDSHGVTASNTIAATCGDWDLRRMWPLQASLVPGLHARTPPLFRSWCNLKVPFGTHTGTRPSGMMGMLRHVGLPHEGTHHRGIDDVRNLARLVIHLLEAGVPLEPTWGERERQAERARYERELGEALSALSAKKMARERLPPSVPDAVRESFDERVAYITSQVERWRAYVSVFSEHPSTGELA